MGNAAGSMEVPPGPEAAAPPAGPQGRAGLKLPVPPGEELERRFGAVLHLTEVQFENFFFVSFPCMNNENYPC
ncbi:hypothetical protein EYF80_036085 [Liparis tanakae]|uniref:Uncharacterized protein n=1 Tax=Liparis tanakae TaxID=230148 RepID=A0A4Z2GK57_9TELE|nr:hypothetical protein EYF80_036085 [Liparis tanakae]